MYKVPGFGPSVQMQSGAGMSAWWCCVCVVNGIVKKACMRLRSMESLLGQCHPSQRNGMPDVTFSVLV